MSQFTPPGSLLKTDPDHRLRKFFTLDEAVRALPLVKRIAVDIQHVQAERLRIHGEMSAGLTEMSSRKYDHLQQKFDEATTRLEGYVEELEKIGVQLKDPARALLDFPAMHEGREILLCWKADEQTITHWHELEAGYAGRKPVALLRA